MRWIRVEVAIGDSPMIGALADALSVSVAEALGLHVQVWAKLPEYAKDGALGNHQVLNATLERWAGWRGKPGAFAKAYRDTCCDEHGVALDWERVNGAAMRESAATTLRVRELRARRKGTPDATPSPTPSVTPRALVPVRRTADSTHASDGDGTASLTNSGTAVPNTDLSKRETNPQNRVENSVDTSDDAETSAVVTRFMARFYGQSTAERRADVARQMTTAIIHKGVTFKGKAVKAVDQDHLDAMCLEVMEEPPRDPNAAWVFVLARLQETYLATLSQRAVAEVEQARRVPAGMTGTAPIGATPLRAAIAGVLDGLDIEVPRETTEGDNAAS